MTLRDLQKAVESDSGGIRESNQQILLQKLRGKQFWNWKEPNIHRERYRVNKGQCCFNHIIGLPKKNGIEYPMFPFEKELYKAIMLPGYLNSNPALLYPNNILYPFKEKHLLVLKATGLGITTFFLRFMAWLYLYNDDYKDSQMVIVVGPNQDLAIKLIKRMKALFFDKLGVTFDSKETVLELNGCSIEAYPSHKIDAFRSLTNPKFILVDEGDYIPKFQQEDCRVVAERYIGKSNPFICFVSTPNRPDGLFRKIEQEPFETCIIKKWLLTGINKIYTNEEIANAKLSPSFPREYQLQYQGLIGNVFSTTSIENCQKIQYNPNNINPHAKKTCGVDAGFGSSNFGIVVTQFVDGKVQVIFAEEYERPNFKAMIDRIWDIKQKCGYMSNIYVDAANPEIWESLKREFDESSDNNYIRDQFAFCKKYNLHIEGRMIVVPVPFSVEGAKMLQHAKYILEETDEDGSSLIAIHKRFDKLLTGLRTAVANEYKLDKTETVYSDQVDAFRLALTFYKRSK
jgi:hypothetical protein